MVTNVTLSYNALEEKNSLLQAHQNELAAQNEEISAQGQQLAASLQMANEDRENLKRLYSFNVVLSKSIDIQELGSSVVQACMKFFNAQAGGMVIKSSDGDYQTIAAIGLDNVPVFSGEPGGMLGRCFKEQTSITVSFPNSSLKTRVRLLNDCSLLHEAYLPVIYHKTILGVLFLARLVDEPFNNQDIRLLEAMMKQSALAINNSFSYMQVQDTYEQLMEQATMVEELNAQLETERDTIKRERNIIRAIIDSTNEAVLMINTNNMVFIANNKWGEYFSYSNINDITEESTSYIIETFNSLHNAEDVLPLIMEAFDNPNTEREFQAIQANRVLQFWTGPVLSDQNDLLGRVFVCRDITKEFEIDKMKSEFVSTVSHELRTPLASILGFSELLLVKKIKDETRVKYTETIYSEAQRLTNLVNDFLDLQRMESGKQVYNVEIINSTDIINEIIERLSTQNYQHTFLIETEKELFVKADRERLIQVLVNLITNAVKFSPEGGKIHVGAGTKGNYAEFYVKDHGLGIPKDVKSQLFKKFFRVDNSDRRKIGGTGLGLAICKEIIEAHGGQIWVESVHGEGSTFYFTLKSAEINQVTKEDAYEPTVLPSKTSYANNATSNEPVVLVVEDDSSLAMLLSAQLQEAGYRVEVRISGEDALVAVHETKPKVVILDILLAGEMNGWTFLQNMKSSPDTDTIPIVISSSISEKQIGLAMGASEYLVKPFEPSRLVSIVNQLISHHEEAGPLMIMPHNLNIKNWLLNRLLDKGLTIKDVINEQDVCYVVVESSSQYH